MKQMIALLLSFSVMLTGCAVMNTQKEAAAMLGVELPRGEEVLHTDTHGGFHGDGLEVTVLRFEEDVLADQIDDTAGWHRLPVEGNVQALLYGVELADFHNGPYLVDDDGVPLVPPVENGYYFFRDRAADMEDPWDDSQIFNRYSFNLTVAVFDTDTNTLYYLAFDT